MFNAGFQLSIFLWSYLVSRFKFVFIFLLAGFFVLPSRAQFVSNIHPVSLISEKTLIPESAKLLSKYIQIESVTGNEGEAGRFLLNQCIQEGLNIRIFSDKNDQFNFAASLYPLDLGLPNIIFLNHVDVVPPGMLENWNYDPFSGMIDQGMIYGRGAIDMKGMAIMQLKAISRFAMEHRNDFLQFNVTMLSVSGEEDFGDLGAGWVVDQFLNELNPMVVYSEGGAGVYGILSDKPEMPVMCISVAEKKALWLELKVKEASSGHGSVPPLVYSNKTAMMELSRILGKKPQIVFDDYNMITLHKLGEIERGFKGFILKNVSFFKPFIAYKLRKDPLVMSTLSNTITLTNINNPAGSTNQIAQETTAELDCRLLPGYSAKKFITNLKKEINHKNTTIEIINQSQEAAASAINEHYFRLESALKKVYPDCEVIPILFPAVTDNNQFRKYGIPTYGINPVCLTKNLLTTIHNTDERISIQNLEEGIMVYYYILQSILKEETNLLTQKPDFLNNSGK